MTLTFLGGLDFPITFLKSVLFHINIRSNQQRQNWHKYWYGRLLHAKNGRILHLQAVEKVEHVEDYYIIIWLFCYLDRRRSIARARANFAPASATWVFWRGRGTWPWGGTCAVIRIWKTRTENMRTVCIPVGSWTSLWLSKGMVKTKGKLLTQIRQ